MRAFTALAAAALFSRCTEATYFLETDYFVVDEVGAFFDKFHFWNTSDPTHGFVDYESYDISLERGLISNTSTNVIMRADSTNIANKGRPSVRIESKETYNSGLIVLDLDHMPGSICGLWPAFWTYGPSWPNNGEIDILEGINYQGANRMTLHTNKGCAIRQTTNNSIMMNSHYDGELIYSSCVSGDKGPNTGCELATRDPLSYGDGFNAVGGGTYATQWTSEYIAVWFFPRGMCTEAPWGPLGDSPDPSLWGHPSSHFDLTCDIPTKFRNHSIVFDITFCGDWAGDAWNKTGDVHSEWPPMNRPGNFSCARQTHCNNCTEFVRSTPQAFTEAYWSVNALRVYQSDLPLPASNRTIRPNATVPVIPSSSKEDDQKPSLLSLHIGEDEEVHKHEGHVEHYDWSSHHRHRH